MSLLPTDFFLICCSNSLISVVWLSLQCSSLWDFVYRLVYRDMGCLCRDLRCLYTGLRCPYTALCWLYMESYVMYREIHVGSGLVSRLARLKRMKLYSFNLKIVAISWQGEKFRCRFLWCSRGVALLVIEACDQVHNFVSFLNSLAKHCLVGIVDWSPEPLQNVAPMKRIVWSRWHRYLQTGQALLK